MIDSKQGLPLSYFYSVFRHRWPIMVVGIVLGLTVALGFCLWVTPKYRSELQFFTWNRSLGEAVKSITAENSAAAASEDKVKTVLLYNNIIAQSMNIGQRLIVDYRKILDSDKVRKQVEEELKDRFPLPLNYSVSASADRLSCIMTIAVVSPDPELAFAAAEATMAAFARTQQEMMNISYAEKIADATKPVKPFFPKYPLVLALGGVFGLALSIGVGAVLEYLDRTIKTHEDFKEVDLLGLGMIPNVQNLAARLENRDFTDDSRNFTALLDNYRIIKTTVCYLNADKPPRLIQITSDLAGIGKSTSILFLGKVFGEDGSKVLIIDCDLRKPSLKNKLNLNCKSGLVDCLFHFSPGMELDDYLERNVFPNVDVMPHGIIPPAPTQLLNSERFASLLTEMRGKYDYILLDSPPIQGMADAMILANLVDGVIIAAQAGKTRTDHLGKTLQQMITIKQKFLGGIITNVSNKLSRYYYNYGYGYGYGYGHDNKES